MEERENDVIFHSLQGTLASIVPLSLSLFLLEKGTVKNEKVICNGVKKGINIP